MKKFLRILATGFQLTAISFLLAGCHPAELVVPSYLHNVGVDPVKNQTSYFNLDTLFTQNLIRQFQLDARMPVESPERTDLLVKVVIRQFNINPIFFDPKTNVVLQYQLSMTYDLAAVDQVEKKTLLEENGKEHSVYYYTPQNVGSVSETQEQATVRLLDEAARLAVRRVLEGY